jgi:hypothetical protein
MGYLDNSSRTLDAILTKKGREILSSGGDFTVTKFALGDDEIDYALWDTKHTSGTDYYGAVIDNLPALEPFNDPSEIMKYKLVTRSEGCRAMVELIDAGTTATDLAALIYYQNPGANDAYRTLVGGNGSVSTKLGGFTNGSKTIKVTRTQNQDLMGGAEGDWGALVGELYTVTLLDASIAVLAPAAAAASDETPFINTESVSEQPLSEQDKYWVPFIDNVQHISQTVPNCQITTANTLDFGAGLVGQGGGNVTLYPKSITQATTTTSIIVTGQSSGAVIEFDVTIELNTTTT